MYERKLGSLNLRNIQKVYFIGIPSKEYLEARKTNKQQYRRLYKYFLRVDNYFSNKDKTSNELKTNVVYEYKCSKYKGIQYIRFTSELLIERVKKFDKKKNSCI